MKWDGSSLNGSTLGHNKKKKKKVSKGIIGKKMAFCPLFFNDYRKRELALWDVQHFYSEEYSKTERE